MPRTRSAAPTDEPPVADLLADLLADERITVVGLLFEAQTALVRRLDTALRADAGMPLATFEVLIRLARSPGGRLRLTELGHQLSITTGGVTRLIDRIESGGLTRRVPDPTDRRAAFAEITADGLGALHRATEVHLRSVQRDLVDALDPGDYRALATALRVLRDHVSGDPATRVRPAPPSAPR
ncbi:MAG: MarR family transcriptional regulator [Pseudonocardia sp.]|nr:MarR family transcriptional regulator [Pseudonocardia sp.]